VTQAKIIFHCGPLNRNEKDFLSLRALCAQANPIMSDERARDFFQEKTLLT
jgi:hypothetical protein